MLIWVSHIITPITILKIFRVRVSSADIHNANIKLTRNGKHVNADITLTETYLVIDKTIKNIIVHIKTQKGWISSSTPQIVATPYPPLNLWNTGQICPNTADVQNTIWVATKEFVSGLNGKKYTKHTASTPLRMSHVSTRSPIFHPKTRCILFAPGLLLP